MNGNKLWLPFVFFSVDCTKDYVQVFSGSSISPDDLIPFPGKAGARICDPIASTFTFSVDSSVITFLYHTDDNNLGDMNVRGVEIPYTLRGMFTIPPSPLSLVQVIHTLKWNSHGTVKSYFTCWKILIYFFVVV